MFDRELISIIKDHIDYKKAIIVQGARQVGKTSLIKAILSGEDALWLDGDDPEIRQLWNNISKANIKRYIQGYSCIVFDEAQRIENIGLAVKMILDLNIKIQVFVSGSSSLDLASSINEPLTGRKWTFELFPFSWKEIVDNVKFAEAKDSLEEQLLFGNYPEIFTATNRKQKRLKELAHSYLYKDILEIAKVRKPHLLVDLLQALSYQVGGEVSYGELSNLLQVDNETIKRYIGLLEDSYVIFKLPTLAKNPRSDISKSRKIYFYDNGIRNALINNFKPLRLRNDIGALWENYVVSEMRKRESYMDKGGKLKFWRAKYGAEIDLIVDYEQYVDAYEIKYNPRKRGRFSQKFKDFYKPQKLETINSANFYEYLEIR